VHPTATPGATNTAAYIELPAMPTTPFWARRHTEAVLGAWQISPEAIDVAVLLTSELVTNAVTAAAGHDEPAAAAPIVQTLRRQPGRIVIEVSDRDPDPPVITNAGPDAESGRGLKLVQALSKEWSYYFPPSGGKVVYCMVSAEDPATAQESQQPPGDAGHQYNSARRTRG
jgi:anti-sigma regulatory factor (Ser/Thr protein kinase)